MKGISAAGLQQVRQPYTPRYNAIDLSAVELHKAIGDRKHEVVRSPRASPRPSQGVDEPTSPRPQTVKPVDKDVKTGYLIGKQMDEAELLKKKREVQRAYFEKVKADEEVSKRIHAETEADQHRVRCSSPTTQLSDEHHTSERAGALHFGGGDEELQRRSRAAQRDVMEYNIKYAEEKRHLTRNPSTQPKINNPTEHLEIARMQTKQFSIGSDASDATNRAKILASRRQYHEQLERDEEIKKKHYDDEDLRNGTYTRAATSGSPKRKGEVQFPTVPYTKTGEYINVSGWAGLNVGGAATGLTASVTNLHQKVSQQVHYRSALDAQRRQSIAIQQVEKEKIAKEFQSTGNKMPYGNI